MTLFNIVSEEFPLVVFTAVTQGVIGVTLLHALATSLNTEASRQYRKFGITFIILLVIGVLASVFHLGDPLHAFSLLSRMGGVTVNGVWHPSWLPLEILGSVVMGVLALIILLTGSRITAYLLLLAGLFTLFAMSSIYGSMSNTVVTWNFQLTAFLFASCSLLLGGMFYRAFFSVEMQEIKLATLVSLGGFALYAIALVLSTLHSAEVHVDGLADNFSLMQGYYGAFTAIGILITALGLGLNFIQDALHPLTGKTPAIIALLLGLVGVLGTRIAFYGLINTHMFLG